MRYGFLLTKIGVIFGIVITLFLISWGWSF
jgi:hypothetical protein